MIEKSSPVLLLRSLLLGPRTPPPTCAGAATTREGGCNATADADLAQPQQPYAPNLLNTQTESSAYWAALLVYAADTDQSCRGEHQ